MTPSKLCRSNWTCTVTATGQATRSENARPPEWRRSSEATCSTLCRSRSRAIQRGGGVHACNRGTAGGLQTCHFLAEAGYKAVPRVWSDSSACRGIVHRTGLGRLRHKEIRHMWTQERLQKGEFMLQTVPTSDNVADLMTKHLG